MRRHLVWRGSKTDLWPVLSRPQATDDLAAALAEPFLGAVDLVIGPDPGGVLFGPLVARLLRVPFAPVCRDRAFFFAGPHAVVRAETGSGELLAHAAAFDRPGRVLLVDDWSESGGTVTGVVDLVASTRARLIGVSLLVDSLPLSARELLESRGVPVRGVAVPHELRRE